MEVRALPPEPWPRLRRHARRPARTGPGCLVALVLLPIVVILGIVIGTVLQRPRRRARATRRPSPSTRAPSTGSTGASTPCATSRATAAPSCTRTASSSPAPAPSRPRTPPSATRPSCSGGPPTASRPVRVRARRRRGRRDRHRHGRGRRRPLLRRVVDGDVDAEAFVPSSARCHSDGAGAVDLPA